MENQKFKLTLTNQINKNKSREFSRLSNSQMVENDSLNLSGSQLEFIIPNMDIESNVLDNSGKIDEQKFKLSPKIIPIESDGVPTCRICLNSESQNLICPCKCLGTVKYVHENCLLEWIHTKYVDVKDANCEICKFHYKIKVTVLKQFNPSEGIKKNSCYCCMVMTFLPLVVFLSSILAFLIGFSLNFETHQKNSYTILGIFIFLISIGILIVLRGLKKLLFIEKSREVKIINFT